MTLNLENIDLGSFGLNEEDQQQTQLNANMTEAVKINPDQHAETVKLSKQSGVPEFAVKSNPEQVQHKLKLDQINLEGMTKRSPATSKFLTTDINNSVIAQEDVMGGLLEGIEETFRGMGGSISVGFDIQGKGLQLAGAEATPDRIDDLVPFGAMPIGMGFQAQQISQQLASNLGIETDEDLAAAKQEASDRLIGEIQTLQKERQTLTPDDLNIVQEGVRAGIESLANMAPGLGLTILSGGRAAPLLATIGAQTFVGSYGESRADGLTPEEAQWFASIDAAIEVGTELIPLKTLSSMLTGSTTGLSKKALKFAVQEMGTEQLATALQTVNSFMFGLDKELENAEGAQEIINIQLRRQAVTAIATIVAGGTQITAVTAVNKTINKLTQTEQSRETQGDIEQRNIDKLSADSAKSKLRERDVESFKQFVREADSENDTHVFIDGVQTSLYLQSKTREEIEADPGLKALANAARESRATGADVAVPIDDFTGDIAGTDTFTQLREHMTMSEETVSPFRQEQHKVETEAYVNTLMAEANENASEYVEAQEIYTTVRDQLIDTGAVNAANASVMAQIVPAWATAQARSSGKTVQQVYQDAGLTIEGPQTGELSRLEGEQVLTQEPVQTVKDIRSSLVEEFEGLKLSLSGTGNTVTLDKIIIPEDQRGQGTGSKVMQRVLDWADRTGKTVALTPSKDFGGSVPRLKSFYKQFGFIENKGKNKDFEISESMYREPALRQEQPDTGGARGYYDPANSVIRLTESADLSTFLHEFAHFMYEMEASGNTDMNESINNWYKRNSVEVAAEATKNLNGNFDALKQGERTNDNKQTVNEADVELYLDTGATGSTDKDAAIRRAVHEQFARGFETYLMEGKSPSIELRNAFRTFSRWLAQIYQALRGDLNVKLDNEMRQVFDRLLATEDQIAAAESRARIEPMFTDATVAGMTEEEFSDYQQRQEKVKDVQTETLRDQLIKALTRKTKQWWKEEKSDIVDEEIDRLSGERIYTTITRLKDGDIKLDHATVKEMVGEVREDKLGRKSTRVSDKLRGMTAKGQKGVHPDEAAAFFGYNSGSEMLAELMATPPIKETAEANAEAQMIERHGDVFTDGTIEQQADEAVQNEERGKLILHELKILSRGTSQRTLDRNTMKSIATDRIGQLSFREIHPGKYRKAEINAAQQSARMLAEGNKEGAAQAKSRQALNYYLGMAATEAKNDTTKIVDRMARYNKKKVREEIQKAEGGYWDQIVKILERFEFRKSATLNQVDQVNQDINTWANERMEVDGDGLVLHNAVLNESYITHWKNVAYSDLQGINDSVKNIEHVARYANKLTRMGEEIEYNNLVEKLVNTAAETGTGRFTKKASTADDVSWMEQKGRWAMAQMTKIPFMMSWMDGNERVGTWFTSFSQPMTDAYNAELEMFAEVGKPVTDMIKNRSKEDVKRHNTTFFIPEIKGTANGTHTGNLKGHEIIAVALNTGNAGNLRKLLLGEQWANPEIDGEISLQNEKLQAVLSHMTKSDWMMVQKMWDQIDLLYPKLAEVHRRTTGLVPPKVEATPVVTEHGTFKGGYYPVKYDPARDNKAAEFEERSDAEVGSMFASNASIQSSVNAGSTNERTGYYAPIHLTLNVVPNHIQETIHYITHHDAVREVNRLLRDPRIKKAVTEKLGPEEFAQLKPWLNDIAKDGRNAPTKSLVDAMFNKLRLGTTLGVMGFKASTGIIQISGLSNTITEVGLENVMQSMRTVLGSVSTMRSAWEFAIENSKVLKHRTQTMDREMMNAMQQLESKRGVLAAVQEASMKHIALIQTYMVDLPSWHAAYIKELGQSGDETKAFQYADWVIENVQGSGATKDMAGLMRNQTKTHTIFTMFMTFFSSLWNMERDLVKGAKSGAYSTTTVAAKAMFLFTIPVIFEMMMRGEFAEPDDEDERLQNMLTKVALYPIQSIPFVRDVVNGVVSGYGYNASPVTSQVEQGLQGLTGISNAILADGEMTKGQIKAVSKLAGVTIGLPGTGQAWATGEHLYDVIAEGEEFTTHQFLFGPERK